MRAVFHYDGPRGTFIAHVPQLREYLQLPDDEVLQYPSCHLKHISVVVVASRYNFSKGVEGLQLLPLRRLPKIRARVLQDNTSWFPTVVLKSFEMHLRPLRAREAWTGFWERHDIKKSHGHELMCYECCREEGDC